MDFWNALIDNFLHFVSIKSATVTMLERVLWVAKMSVPEPQLLIVSS